MSLIGARGGVLGAAGAAAGGGTPTAIFEYTGTSYTSIFCDGGDYGGKTFAQRVNLVSGYTITKYRIYVSSKSGTGSLKVALHANNNGAVGTLIGHEALIGIGDLATTAMNDVSISSPTTITQQDVWIVFSVVNNVSSIVYSSTGYTESAGFKDEEGTYYTDTTLACALYGY